jgi:hypothetical protein
MSSAGGLLVHSQKMAFALDLRRHTYCDIYKKPKRGRNPIIIRSKDHGIARTKFLDDYSVQKLQGLGQNHADFVALSMIGYLGNRIDDIMIARYIFRHFGHFTVRAF